MSALVLAEHAGGKLLPATLTTVAAAVKLGGDGHVLVAGSNCKPAAEAAAKIAGVTKVLLADDVRYAEPLAEPYAALIVSLAKSYAAVLAAATTVGKNIMPRAAALLDVAQISDIIAVVGPDTFVRPIYAGNALATVKSTDAIKIITVRGTGFEAVKAEGRCGGDRNRDGRRRSGCLEIHLAPGIEVGASRTHRRPRDCLGWTRHGLGRQFQIDRSGG